MQYCEGPRGEPADRRPVVAANRRLQQKSYEYGGLSSHVHWPSIAKSYPAANDAIHEPESDQRDR